MNNDNKLPVQEDWKYGISIIIPVYNTVEYLDECLQSILNQSFRDVEVICADDGSTDGSLEKLHEYADKYSNVKVLSAGHHCVSAVRSMGLEAARGKYIYFMDSDDYIVPDALQIMFDTSERDSLDVLYFDADSVFTPPELEREYDNYVNLYKRNHIYTGVKSGQELMTELEPNREYRVNAYLQFLNHSFLRRINADFNTKVIEHEDNLFTFEVMLQAERVECIDKMLYVRRIRGSSVVTRKTVFRNMYGVFCAAYRMALFAMTHELTPEVEISAANIISRAYSQAIHLAKELDKKELAKANYIPPLERFLYKYSFEPHALAVGGSIAKERRMANENAALHAEIEKLCAMAEQHGSVCGELDRTRRELTKAHAELSRISNSRSYKLAKSMANIHKRVKRFFIGK